jgi:hypothetical protein
MSKNTSEMYFETALAPVTIRFSVKNAVAITAAVIFTRAAIRGIDTALGPEVAKLRRYLEKQNETWAKATQEREESGG